MAPRARAHSPAASSAAAPPADDGWGAAVRSATAGRTILDDPIDLEDKAIFTWMKAHQLPHFIHAMPAPPLSCSLAATIRPGPFVVGSVLLPPHWMVQKAHFETFEDARSFLRPLQRNTAAIHVVVNALNQVDGPMSETAEGTLDRLARYLFEGRMWLLPLRKPPSLEVGKTDPSVYNALNARYHANLDIDKLSAWEGGQYVRGYVPFSHGIVAGRSGMTIATGFDLGQHTADQLRAIIGLSSDGLASILPYAGRSFPTLSRQQVIDQIGRIGPIPWINKHDADVLDGAAGEATLTATMAAWATHRRGAIPAFGDLPSAWQTVMFSRTYNQGPGWVGPGSPTHAFFAAAIAGRWQEAVQALRNAPVSADWFQTRVHEEAAYLAAHMPQPIPAHGPGAAAAAPAAGPAVPRLP